MKYLIGLLCFFSVAQAQFAPTSAKSKFVNGIGIGSKDTSQFTAADTIALTIARDSVMYYRYRGFWRPIATGGNLSAYKLISDTLFANGYTTRARLKQGLDSLAATKGTVNSVGLTMPSAFNVANSPITSSGTISVTAAGNATQYIRGDGALATLPTSGSGGGASVSYYLNGSVNQGTIGGVTYYEMNKTPIIGAGTDFSINANGYVSSFLTDANDPALLKIPAGNWNFETYFSASSGGGTPTFYIELYKYNGTTFTLIASNSGSPKLISDGTNIEAYFSTLAVPETVLTLTDRLAVRIYVSHSGRTITLHTENGHLCQIITTFTTGLTALNGLTEQVQYFATGTSGTDFNIASSVATHTFNLPTASATNRGALSSANWTTFNNKIGAGDTAAMLLPYLRKTDTAAMLAPYYRTATATAALATKLNISDTAAMLSPYARTANLPSLAPYKLISDTLFNNGYTTRGTTKKVIDSLAALELNISDTAAMLLGYTRVQRFTDSLTNVQSRIQTKQNILTLTTTGTSGAATLVGATLNIPQYQAALTNPVTGTGTSGQVAYFNGTNSITSSSNFVWDNTNIRLALGGANIAGIALRVLGSEYSYFNGGLQTGLGLTQTTNGLLTLGGTNALFRINGAGTTNASRIEYQQAGTTRWFGGINTNSDFSISTDGGMANGLGIFLSSRNVVIGQGTDAGFRLDVNGTARFGANLSNNDVLGNLNFRNASNVAYIQQENSTSRSIQIPGTGGNADWIFRNSGSGWGLQGIFVNGTFKISGPEISFSSSSIVGVSCIGVSGTQAQDNRNIYVGSAAILYANEKGYNIRLIAGAGGTSAGDRVGGDVFLTPGAGGGAARAGNVILSHDGTNERGNVAIGTSTLATATELTLGGSQTASSAIARGQLLNTTLVAAANNDVLVGLDINPTFTNGAFTGVSNLALRVTGAATFSSSVTVNSSFNGLGFGSFGRSVDGSYRLIVQGQGSSSSTYGLSVTDNGGVQNLWVRDDGVAYLRGNLLVGTTTDNGARLQVSGAGTFSSNVTTNGNFVLATPGQRIAFDNNLRYILPVTSADRLRISQNAFATGIEIGFDNGTSFSPSLTIASTGAATFSSLAGTGTRMVEASSAGLLSATKIVDAGTYTPTLANQSNVSAISSESGFTLAQYTRIGNQVTVSGTLNVTPTASNTQTAFTMTLPITGTSSNIGSGMLTSGTIAGNFISGFGLVFGSTNQVQFYFKSDGTSLMRIQYTFSYTL